MLRRLKTDETKPEENMAYYGETYPMRSILLAAMVAVLLTLGVGMTSAQAPAPTLMSTSDITCAGVFLTPPVNTGTFSSWNPVAMRYENGNRHYFVYAGNGHVYEFPEPTLSPCNTPLTSVNRARMESWGGDWGTFPVSEATNYIPGQGATIAFGLNYDDKAGELLLNWTGTYSNSGLRNSFAAAKLDNATHKINVRGCWGTTGWNTLYTGTGTLMIPDSFVAANLPPGVRWGVGFGGPIGQAAQISVGPTLIAMAPPPDNVCAPQTNNLVSGGLLMAQYPANANGPTCAFLGMGCTPTRAPGNPHPAEMAFKDYSMEIYTSAWDPWNGHGWFAFDTHYTMDWYDDGVKHGVVVPMSVSEGWSNTTVLATPAPTLDTSTYYPNGVMYVASTSTHDGLNMNPGDLLWVQTCTPGVDGPACVTVNGNHLAYMIIDAVNPATGQITFHLTSPDASGWHAPVPGGIVKLGCFYAHGMPTCSRYTYRLQIYDPAQYGEVLRGTRKPYDVKYTDEMDLSTFVQGFGSPRMGKGVDNRHHMPNGVMMDPAAHQMMISFGNANSPLYQVSNAIYVFNVGPSAVTPPIAPQPPPSPTPGTATVTPPPPPPPPSSTLPTGQISASPSTITAGSSTILTWSTSNTTSISITPSIDSNTLSGSKVVKPTVSTTYTLTATNSSGSTTTKTLVTVGSITDITAPSVPVNLSASVVSSSQIALAWNAATDNVGVAGYKIVRNGIPIGTSTTTSYSNSGLTASTTSSYTVFAYDAAGNNSAPSASVSATTSAAVSFDFSLSNSGNLTVQAGASATDTISATLSAGSSQGVTLSASGLPAGTTASFTTSSCRPNCATVVTIKTAASTLAGSFPITVTARSERLSRSTTFTLTVTAAPGASPTSFDFSLANGGTMTLAPARSGVTMITATRVNGTAQPISFSATGFPTGVTSSFAQGTCAPTCYSPLSMTTSASVPAGNYPITVTARSEGLSRSTTFTLAVTALPPVATPTLTPSGGSYSGSVSVTMQTATAGAAIYFSTDGSTPTQASRAYTDAVTLTSSAVVKAKAYKSSYAPSAETSAAFTFNQLFNFTLTNSGNLSVQAGASATDTISATLSAGSTSQGVTLSASGLPAGTTASFATSSCRPNCATVVTLRTSGATPTGSYPITVTARGGEIGRTTAFTLTVTAASTDTMSPTVAIASPANSATVSGNAALVSATASDNVGVVGVQFKLDSQNLGVEDTTAPYSMSWNTTNTSQGAHTLRAVARDAAGNSTTSSAVNVTVNNAAADTTAPSVPSTLSASVISASQINLSWNASTDNVGVTGYKIFRGGTQIGIAPAASYAVTGLSPSTTYSFTVSAYDAAGNNSAQSASVNATTISNSSAEPLLQSSNLTYLGAFRVPPGAIGGSAYGFAYTVTGFAFNPINGSLFLNSHIYEQKTAEISIPQPVVSSSLSSLPTAKLIQNFADLTEGHRTNIYANGAPNLGNSTYIGGLMVYGNKLIGDAYDYYDGGHQAKLSHFSSSLTLSQTGDFQGMFTVGSMNPGFVAGYMTPIPSQWQSALGGPALTGQCCIAIIGRSSLGPSAFVFNPDEIGVKNPVPATPVVYYDLNHPSLGTWGNTTTANVNYNMSTAITGVAFPQGTSSVLFFGRTGIGVPCYGSGTKDQTLDRQPVPGTNGAVMYCYDPDNSSKGTHSYPYRAQVWAYDVQDLIAVKSGTKNPWGITPYAVWDLNLPFHSASYDLVGTAYDATTKKIYVAQSGADPGNSGMFQGPIIHVYQVN